MRRVSHRSMSCHYRNCTTALARTIKFNTVQLSGGSWDGRITVTAPRLPTRSISCTEKKKGHLSAHQDQLSLTSSHSTCTRRHLGNYGRSNLRLGGCRCPRINGPTGLSAICVVADGCGRHRFLHALDDPSETGGTTEPAGINELFESLLPRSIEPSLGKRLRLGLSGRTQSRIRAVGIDSGLQNGSGRSWRRVAEDGCVIFRIFCNIASCISLRQSRLQLGVESGQHLLVHHVVCLDFGQESWHLIWPCHPPTNTT